MLKNQKTATSERMNGKNINWIINTGASNHMTGCLENLSNVRNISNCPVEMPDGGKTEATKKRSVELASNLTLDNVLYVTGLTYNMISVSQLTDNSKCFVQFTNSLCVTGLRFEDADWGG